MLYTGKGNPSGKTPCEKYLEGSLYSEPPEGMKEGGGLIDIEGGE
jgi:hypothetical protein